MCLHMYFAVHLWVCMRLCVLSLEVIPLLSHDVGRVKCTLCEQSYLLILSPNKPSRPLFVHFAYQVF